MSSGRTNWPWNFGTPVPCVIPAHRNRPFDAKDRICSMCAACSLKNSCFSRHGSIRIARYFSDLFFRMFLVSDCNSDLKYFGYLDFTASRKTKRNLQNYNPSVQTLTDCLRRCYSVVTWFLPNSRKLFVSYPEVCWQVVCQVVLTGIENNLNCYIDQKLLR